MGLLCAYFSDPNNQETSQINKGNKAQAHAMYTDSSKTMARAIEAAEQKLLSQGITPTSMNLYLSTHSSSYNSDTNTYTYPDDATKEYCERVVEEATIKGIGTTPGNDRFEFSLILDSIHGGHHGGYERGLGIGPTRHALKRAKVPNAQPTTEQCMEAALQVQREKMEAGLQAQTKKMEAELQAQAKKMEAEMQAQRIELLELKEKVNSGRSGPNVDVSSGSGILITSDEIVEIAHHMMENGAGSDAIKRFMAWAFKNSS